LPGNVGKNSQLKRGHMPTATAIKVAERNAKISLTRTTFERSEGGERRLKGVGERGKRKSGSLLRKRRSGVPSALAERRRYANAP